MCYATSEQRARLIVAALDHFKASGKMAEFFEKEDEH